MTRQKRIILEELRKVTSHPTADAIYEMVRKRIPRISLGTVYRNLEVLSRQGEIQKLNIDSERVRFDGNPSEHCHIRCVVCGRVDDFPVEPTVSLKELNSECGYEILGNKLEFYGKCPECRKTKPSYSQLTKIKEGSIMIDKEGKKVLEALSGFEKPASGKEIAQAAGMDSKIVISKIKTLKSKGLVESPVRCKYCVTPTGRETLS